MSSYQTDGYGQLPVAQHTSTYATSSQHGGVRVGLAVLGVAVSAAWSSRVDLCRVCRRHKLALKARLYRLYEPVRKKLHTVKYT